MSTASPLAQTLAAFDAANNQDPNQVLVDDKLQAREFIYGRRMSARLADFLPDASESLQLAVRSQHICRWQIPRSDYPMDRVGYQRWRTDLAKFHGTVAGDIMAAQGYEAELIERVRTILLKRKLKHDAEVQALEDVACLVFLEYYLADFATQHDTEKLINIIRKTWQKMSAKGHEAALALSLSPAMSALIQQALQSD